MLRSYFFIFGGMLVVILRGTIRGWAVFSRQAGGAICFCAGSGGEYAPVRYAPCCVCGRSLLRVQVSFTPLKSDKGSIRYRRFIARLARVFMTNVRLNGFVDHAFKDYVVAAVDVRDNVRNRRSVIVLLVLCMYACEPARLLATRYYAGRFGERVEQALREEATARFSGLNTALHGVRLRIFPFFYARDLYAGRVYRELTIGLRYQTRRDRLLTVAAMDNAAYGLVLLRARLLNRYTLRAN